MFVFAPLLLAVTADPTIGRLVNSRGAGKMTCVATFQPENRLATESWAPHRKSESALDTDSVKETGYAIGDTVLVLTTGPRNEAEVIGGVTLDDGTRLKADHQLAGGPSVLFDAVVVVASSAGTAGLLGESAAVAWVHDAFAHLKVIGYAADAQPLLDAAGVRADAGIVPMASDGADFIEIARAGRIWDREPTVRSVF